MSYNIYDLITCCALLILGVFLVYKIWKRRQIKLELDKNVDNPHYLMVYWNGNKCIRAHSAPDPRTGEPRPLIWHHSVPVNSINPS